MTAHEDTTAKAILLDLAPQTDLDETGDSPESPGIPPLAVGVPTIILAAQTTAEHRLAAARAGAAGFLPRAALAPEVISFVEWVVASRSIEPMAVLAVSTSAECRQTIAAALPEPEFRLISLDSPARFGGHPTDQARYCPVRCRSRSRSDRPRPRRCVCPVPSHQV